MDHKLLSLLKRLSFVICEGCPKRSECDQKVSNPIQCEKMSLINRVMKEIG